VDEVLPTTGPEVVEAAFVPEPVVLWAKAAVMETGATRRAEDRRRD